MCLCGDETITNHIEHEGITELDRNRFAFNCLSIVLLLLYTEFAGTT